MPSGASALGGFSSFANFAINFDVLPLSPLPERANVWALEHTCIDILQRHLERRYF